MRDDILESEIKREVLKIEKRIRDWEERSAENHKQERENAGAQKKSTP